MDGGIVPYNIPTEIQEYMANNIEWSVKPLNIVKPHRPILTPARQDLIMSSSNDESSRLKRKHDQSGQEKSYISEETPSTSGMVTNSMKKYAMVPAK